MPYKKVLTAIILVLSGVLLYAALKSPEVHIAREILIDAPPEAIFPYLNNSKKTTAWMTWTEDDPSVKMTYSGPDEGKGSTANWESKGNMGTGSAEIIESIPNRSVKTKLTYTKPMEMSQMAELSLKPSAKGTVVVWSLDSRNPFILRLMCLFGNMEKMVGTAFDKGLARLKNTVLPASH